MAKQVWEFTFVCIMEGRSREEAFQAALDYLAEQASKRELEYSGAEFLDETEDD